MRWRSRWYSSSPPPRPRGAAASSASTARTLPAPRSGAPQSLPPVLPFVVDAPALLTAPTPDGYARLPATDASLAALGVRLVHRYGPGGTFWTAHPQLTPHPIRAWQVWNEPNLVHKWYRRPDPHTGLLRTDASAKPALAAFRDAARRARHTGRAPADDERRPGAGRGRLDHHPRVRFWDPAGDPPRARSGRAGGSASAAASAAWSACAWSSPAATHARIVMRRAGSRTIRIAVRSSLRRQLAARRRVRMALEIADIARTPLRLVARIRLTAVSRGG